VWNETRDVCLVFSGENFGDQSQIDELKAKGHRFNGENASYLVHLYEELGFDFFQKLNGWFSGVLVDLRADRVILFNDRYGLGRIYYHENAGGFYFSSEAKSLLKVIPRTRELDLKGLGESCSCGCVLQNRTLFAGIGLVPGGSIWIFSRSQKPSKETYFKKKALEQQSSINGVDFYQKLKETFPRVLKKYLHGESRIAMSLTGGLDGRMIMAWASAHPGTLPCFSFGGIYRDCSDVTLARQVAKTCHQPHRVITVGSEFLRGFPALAEKAIYISDGTMDVTGSVELYANSIAREIASIRLTGNYGSEILRGNVAFKPGPLCEGLFAPEFSRFVRAADETYADELKDNRLSFIAFKQVPWHHYSRLAVEQSQLTLRAPYLDNELVDLMYQAPPGLTESKEPFLRLIADGNPGLSRIRTDRGILYRPIPVITKVNHLYQEFTFKAEYAYDYGMPQWLAGFDHIFAPLHFERLFLGRHKFHHFRVWYRDELYQYLKDILLDPLTRNRAYMNGSRLEKILNDHIAGHRNYTLEIHRALTTELIQRQLIEQK